MTLTNKVLKLLTRYSEYALAELLGCSQSTVWRIKNGSEPRYSVGVEIEALYAREFSKE